VLFAAATETLARRSLGQPCLTERAIAQCDRCVHTLCPSCKRPPAAQARVWPRDHNYTRRRHVLSFTADQRVLPSLKR
jgi:hypothetical protein